MTRKYAFISHHSLFSQAPYKYKTNTLGVTPNISTEVYNYSGSTIMHHIKTVKLPKKHFPAVSGSMRHFHKSTY